MIRNASLLWGILLVTGCRATAPDAPTNAQDRFWASLQQLCGSAYQGQITQASPADTAFAGKALIMHVRSCSATEVHTAFNVGDNRSRTWIISRTATGLRLKHDHRHEDGSEDALTQYGGDTRTHGTAETQEFFADAHTAALLPAAATNVWTVEIRPSQVFAYALRREGTDRRFRVEFDLSRKVPAPPPSWGHSQDRE